MPFVRALRFAAFAAFAVAAGFAFASAAAAETLPPDWAVGFPEPATGLMERVDGFHDWLLVLCYVISALVFVLLAICIVRFNARANPNPSRRSHNPRLETIWTLIPALILVVLAFPSYSLLRAQLTLPAEGALVIKATGSQWYWSYEYPDYGIDFDSIMVEDEDLRPGQPRLLTTDNPVYVPVGRDVVVQTTAADVIHAWTIPAFGVKIDSVPGRLNETWFRAEREGTFYGQCSELCGSRHAYMPIEVRVVSQRAFARWIRAQSR